LTPPAPLRRVGDFHLVPYSRDPAVLADEECRALDPHVFPAVHAFFGPDAIGFEHVFRFVGREREAELVFGLESRMGCHRIRRNAKDCCASLFEIALQAIKVDRFLGAAGSIVLRIEIKNKLLAGKACK